MQYSVFGSTLTIGGVIGGLVSGRLADYIGRKGISFFVTFLYLKAYCKLLKLKTFFFFFFLVAIVMQAMWFSKIFSLAGWLAIAFGKVFSFALHSNHVTVIVNMFQVMMQNGHGGKGCKV